MHNNKEKKSKEEIILAVETSGRALSAAVSVNGCLVSEITLNCGLVHSEKLIEIADLVLSKAGYKISDVTKIAACVGPGSFTGIRVGLTFARTAAQSLKVPLVGIDAIKILAAAAPETGCLVYPVIDALRNEVYVPALKSGKPCLSSIEDSASALKALNKNILLLGGGAGVYRDFLKKRLGKKVFFAPENMSRPLAGTLAVIAHGLRGEYFEKVLPLYIRRSWAEERQKSGK